MDIVRLAFRSKRLKDKLAPGAYYPLWQFEFTEAGVALLFIRADVSSSRPVKLAIYQRQDNAQWREVWAQPSTRMVDDAAALAAFGPYEMKIYDIVVLETPGSYELRIENPSSVHVFFTASIKVFMGRGPAVEFWLRQYIKSAIKYATLSGVKTKTAPMGIAVYGVKKDGRRYSTYPLTTDAVKGVVYIPPDVSASSYRLDGSYYGQAFSVQLNAFVVAELKNGTMRYYWIQNAVRFDEKREGLKGLEVLNNIWGATTSILDDTVEGKCEFQGNFYHGNFYHCNMPGSIPFGRVELEMRTYVDGGKIIVEFYANGKERDKVTMYDKVTITPRVPATSAHIKIAPYTTPTGHPLNLELVFGGPDRGIPWAVLKRGRVGLELYVNKNGAWVPPPSAWSVGRVTTEASHARVELQGVGSALVVPGEPNLQQLWSNPIKTSIDDPKIFIAAMLTISLVLDKILDDQQWRDIAFAIAAVLLASLDLDA